MSAGSRKDASMKKKPKGTTIFNIVVLLFSVGMLAYFGFSEDGLPDLLKHIDNFNSIWLLAAAGFMFLNFIADIWLTQLFVRISYPRYRFTSATRVAMAGQFYNNVTPYGVAGKPMQIVVMNRQGVDVGRASSAMMQKFLVYQATLSFYSLVVILFRYTFFRNQINDMMFLTIIAFVFQAGIIVLLMIFSYSKKLTKTILELVFLLLKKIRILKHPEETLVKIENELEMYHENCKVIQKHKGLMILSVLLTIMQLTCYYIVPYCVYRCFDFNQYSAFDLVAAQAFVSMVSSYMPTPGGTGAAEGSFVVMFKVFFGDSVKSAMVLWRLFSYYMTILVSAPFSAMGKKKSMDQPEKGETLQQASADLQPEVSEAPVSPSPVVQEIPHPQK